MNIPINLRTALQRAVFLAVCTTTFPGNFAYAERLSSTALPGSAAPADKDRKPRKQSEAQHHEARFEEFRAKGLTWLPGLPMPENLEQAGLGKDWRVVRHGHYLDGGTEGFLLLGGEDHYLAFCTGPGLESPEGRTFGKPVPVGSRLFIGGTHYTDKEARPVPEGSAAETFLRSLMPRNRSTTWQDATRDSVSK